MVDIKAEKAAEKFADAVAEHHEGQYGRCYSCGERAPCLVETLALMLQDEGRERETADATVRELKEALGAIVKAVSWPCDIDDDRCHEHGCDAPRGECPVARARRLTSE